MVKVSISNCPFCGGKAEVDTMRQDVGEGSYMRTLTYVRVMCTKCEARSGDIRQKPFCDVTEYTVQDFRDDPSLREVEKDKYDEYCKSLEGKAIDCWNERFTNN